MYVEGKRWRMDQEFRRYDRKSAVHCDNPIDHIALFKAGDRLYSDRRRRCDEGGYVGRRREMMEDWLR